MLFESRVETKLVAGVPHFIASGESVAPIVVKSKLRDVVDEELGSARA